MYNILVDDLPTAIEINGNEFDINPDYRNCLNIILAYEDNELTGFEKQLVLLSNLYKEFPDNEKDIETAVLKGIKFLNGGMEENEGENQELLYRLYSFSTDANLIFAAFKQTHGIDLNDTEYLHWWKFIALFMDLGSETTFCNLVSLRKRVKSGKATKEEREAAKEMGEFFEVPEPNELDLEEMEAERKFMEMINKHRIG